MKTNEFLRKVDELQAYDIEYLHNKWIRIFNQSTKEMKASIYLNRPNDLGLNSTNMKFIKLCVEYAETPLSEREEEKKYIVILPEPESKSTSKVVLIKTDDNRVIMGMANIDNIKNNPRFHLNEQEIKRSYEYLWPFAKEVR